MIKPSFELKGVKEALEQFDSKKVKAAIRSTLDRSATQGKQEIVKAVSDNYNIKPKDVRDVTEVQRTTQTALETKIRIARKKLSLAYFRARQTATGVVAHVRKSGASVYPSAFIIRKFGGKVFRRKTEKRFPIKHMAGPAVTEIVKLDNIMDKVQKRINESMQKLFPEEIKKRVFKR
ncbi:MAG: hypothetical protein FJ110_04610 [Deltaproteobacteria bacterium]|nr:hypothetical protein [Deltaproteobacteria bacterium]